MKIFLRFILLFTVVGSVAQTSLVNRLHAMQLDPRLKEKVYIHTNKTSYFPDDVIWFKAYLGDTINCPSWETTKLYVNLLDISGTVIYKKNVFIDEGVGQGEFELNSAVIPGKYYIQAYTNYMRNFGEDYHSLQAITILGETVENRETEEIKYDVQLLPEGGYLLEGIQNVMGIKAMVNGLGSDFSGKIINSNGKSVASFKNEHLGMTQCKFLFKAGENYTARISINDTLLNIGVPQPLRKGMALHVDSSDETYITIHLKTNKATFLDSAYSNYSILCRQERQIVDFLSVTRIDSTTGTIKINKSKFLEGVNAVTLFKDEKPIAERKFFIEKEQKQVVTQLDRLNIENDSVRYKLRLSSKQLPVDANLSISVLSEETNTYIEKQNIHSSFLLTSFLKGNIENPAYFFDQKNPDRIKHLDLLLLTQGWTQYSLPEMIAQLNPYPKFEFEKGFELKGKLEGHLQHKRLALIADDYQIIDTVNLKGNGRFQFSNLLLFKGDTVKVSYLDKTGKIIAPDTLWFDDTRKKRIPHPKRVEEDVSTAVAKKREQLQHKSIPQDSPPLQYERGTIALEGVTLTDRKLSQRMVERRKLIKKYETIVPDIGKYYNRSVSDSFKEQDLMSFLKIKEGIRIVDAQGLVSHLEAPDRKKAFLFIDGRLIDSPELPSVSLYMSDIENVMVGPNLKIPFVIERSTFIHVFTKNSYRNNTIAHFNEQIVKNGFDREKEYYSPMYDFETEQFSDLVEVDWKPIIKTDKNGVAFIKVPKKQNHQKYFFSIQGFSENGHLISELIIE